MLRLRCAFIGTVIVAAMTAPAALAQDGCYCLALYDPICGTDGKTYGNECEAGCAGVGVASIGECPENPFAYCALVNCGINEDPMCGEDGRTYGNKCKANCIGNIAVAHEGPCRAEEEEEEEETMQYFPDTRPDSEEGQAAAQLRTYGIIQGYPDGTFGGHRSVNRAEAAKIALDACWRPASTLYTGRFSDVPPDAWFTIVVESAATQGIITGHPDGTFRPAATVNRAEFAKMFANACRLKPITRTQSHFWRDVSPDDWFSTYVHAIEGFSLFLDIQDGYLHPTRPMTRAEVAIAVMRYISTVGWQVPDDVGP